MDYGIEVLKEMLEKIKNMPAKDLKAAIVEADTRFKKIQQKRGEQFRLPVIKRTQYKETSLFSEAAADYSFRMAA